MVNYIIKESLEILAKCDKTHNCSQFVLTEIMVSVIIVSQMYCKEIEI